VTPTIIKRLINPQFEAVRRTNETIQTGIHQISYDELLYNVGGGMDVSGRFVAPEKGIYQVRQQRGGIHNLFLQNTKISHVSYSRKNFSLLCPAPSWTTT
jgi:hypothetical protein